MRSKFDPQKHHRRSIRLKGYDYSSNGAYYVTIVTQGREHIFGKIVGGKMILNDAGEMILKWWDELPNKFPNVVLGASIVMPNHFHGIIFIVEYVGADTRVRLYRCLLLFLLPFMISDSIHAASGSGGG